MPDLTIDDDTHNFMKGYYLYMVETTPSSTNPTALYDITILNDNSVDIMSGTMANRSATLSEIAYPQTAHPIDLALTFTVSNNAVVDASATIKLYLVK